MREEKLQVTDNWKLTWISHCDVPKEHGYITTYDELCCSGHQIINARVPGNVELDMMRAGLLPDLFFGTNMELERKLEVLHFWYGCRFTYSGIPSENCYLKFGGVDTIAEIYLNGQLIGTTDNMLIEHQLKAVGLREGANDLVVHIMPVNILARELPSNPLDYANSYNYASLRVRKAAHTFGWDIMPRALSAGLWRDIWVCTHDEDEIEEYYLYTSSISPDSSQAELALYFRARLSQDETTRYSLRVEGRCEESSFSQTYLLWFSNGKFRFCVPSPKLWNATGYGAPSLYEVTLTLLLDEKPVDIKHFRLGIRTVELIRTSYTDKASNGCFYIQINGKRIYALGTNWAPLDPFHSRDRDRLARTLDLVVELGCNIIRCWGGNVYEDHEFFEFCDEHGILVWQDFAMACAVHPNEETLYKQLHSECLSVVKKLRQHPSLAIWAGDNECDVAFSEWIEIPSDPNQNFLTRKIIPAVLRAEDPTRPYLPSSPYVDEKLYEKKDNKYIPENHLWDTYPRKSFKSPFYKDTMAHFISEVGFFGSVSPASAGCFLSPECIWPADNREWMMHCAPPDSEDGQYSFRRQMMFNQILFFFGLTPDTFEEFALASQIVQAEALKFFIESFRMKKPRTAGIIWWNLIDGWPQFSDAVVDYYYRKKLSFSYIKCSQKPLCLMFSEPENHRIQLKAVNDNLMEIDLSYEIFDICHNQRIVSSSGVAHADAVTLLETIEVNETVPCLFKVVWQAGSYSGENHYLLGEPAFYLKDVVNWLNQADLLKLDGFTSVDN